MNQTCRPAPAGQGSLGGDGTTPLLARARLLERLRAGVAGPLTVVAAPAGYGKGVLLDQWAAGHHGSPVVQIAFDAADHPARFAARLAEAAATLGVATTRTTGAASRVSGTAQEVRRAAVAAFARSLGRVGEVVLVVSTAHASPGVTLGEELDHLVVLLPPNVHLVLVRRGARPLPTLATGEPVAAVVLGESDLAFTVAETAEVVARVIGRRLDGPQNEELHRRTGGWPLAVTVAALAIRRALDPDVVIQGLRGDHRHLAAYFETEVLDRYPDRLHRFLRRTSLLDVLTPASCAALADDPAAAEILQFLEADGGFIRRVSPNGERFVHHTLFREFLRAELSCAEPEVEGPLQARAAQWWVSNDEVDRAAQHLVAAERWDELIDLADRQGRALFEDGRAAELLRWLEAVPVTSTSLRCRVGLRRACVLTMLGSSRAAEEVLREIGDCGLSVGEQIVADVLRAVWIYTDATGDEVVEVADSALGALADADASHIPDLFGLTSADSLRILLRCSRARALWYARDLVGARNDLGAVATRSDAHPAWQAHALGTLSLLEAWSGDLGEAERHGGHALRVARANGLEGHPASVDARAGLAHVHRQRDDLARAEALLDEAQAVVTAFRRPVAGTVVVIERALCLLAGGRPEAGLAAVRADQRKGEVPPPAVISLRRRAVEVRLLLACGEVAQAEQLVSSAGGPVPVPLPPELGAVAVQVAVARGDLDAARVRLAEWATWPADARASLEHGLWTAILNLEAGSQSVAIRGAGRVLERAEADGHHRLFLDHGGSVLRLVRVMARVTPSPAVERIAEVLTVRGEAVANPAGLSQRELDVVRYLPTSLSSTQIAAGLYISQNTLKSHLSSIYRKFEVSDRRAAAARAEQLGLA
jgi:LuxR family maltose regulon positive regulatory protein